MKFGILGEAKIAREHVVPAILNAGHEVTHVGRRIPGKASLPKIYGNAIETDYESLINDPSIDAIYNPLPNHLHVPYSIEALKSNKHVLCEKPVAINLKELLLLDIILETKFEDKDLRDASRFANVLQEKPILSPLRLII